MTRAAAVLAIVMLATVAAGCATTRARYTLVEPSARAIDTFYTVEPQLAWTSYASGKIETWTIDGFLLETLRFYKGIDDGEPLIKGGANEDKRPRFRTALTPTEITELVVESIFGPRITPKNVRPAPFGSAQGFRFELTYFTRDGVKRDALVAGAVLDKRLHVIVYDGTSLYHFGKYRADAERVIESVRLK
jgi:hypothetical protein